MKCPKCKVRIYNVGTLIDVGMKYPRYGCFKCRRIWNIELHDSGEKINKKDCDKK